MVEVLVVDVLEVLVLELDVVAAIVVVVGTVVAVSEPPLQASAAIGNTATSAARRSGVSRLREVSPVAQGADDARGGRGRLEVHRLAAGGRGCSGVGEDGESLECRLVLFRYANTDKNPLEATELASEPFSAVWQLNPRLLKTNLHSSLQRDDLTLMCLHDLLQMFLRTELH